MTHPNDSTATQERIAHLERVIDDLSAAAAEQANRIDMLERRVAMLVTREAERQAEGAGGIVLGDERPPHW